MEGGKDDAEHLLPCFKVSKCGASDPGIIHVLTRLYSFVLDFLNRTILLGSCPRVPFGLLKELRQSQGCDLDIRAEL